MYGLLWSASDHDQIIDYILWSHSRKNKTMNPIAKLVIIHTSLDIRRLPWISVVTVPHRASYYIQTGHWERGSWGVVSQLQQQQTLCVCVVCCDGRRPSCHHLLDRVHSLLYTGPQILTSEYLTDLTPGWLKQSQLPPHTHTGQLTDGDRPSTVVSNWQHSGLQYSESLAYCATLGGTFDHNQWLRSVVDDVTIIDHFVKWPRLALLREFTQFIWAM